MSKVSSRVKSDSLTSRIDFFFSRVLMLISYSRYKLTNLICVVDLSSSGRYLDYVRAHRFCDLVITESDCKWISAFHSSRIMLMDMRRISSLHTLYVVSY